MVSRENIVPKLARIPLEGILHNLRPARPVFVLDATERHGMVSRENTALGVAEAQHLGSRRIPSNPSRLRDTLAFALGATGPHGMVSRENIAATSAGPAPPWLLVPGRRAA
mmetsp:Transcript_95273/g.116642  ORF Transcript_95273/g.116642 Transcript_95273/m.116642 type:complete len:111 (+) Transcript_95273:123-455(+)